MTNKTLTGPTYEEALFTLLRLTVNEDLPSARQYARQLMRRPPDGTADPTDFAARVGQLLASSGHGPRYTRGKSATSQIDSDTDLPLLREVEELDVVAPILPPATWSEVERFINEQLHLSELTAAGLTASRTLLLTGPPGVGKSMTAAYVASRMGRGLMQLDLAGVISSFLGKTGQNLRRVLDYARERQGVLLLDEFDAVAKRRDDETDVGELKRIVNVLLVELESWPDGHVLIAATNHPELLDRAVRRRFDALIDLPMPGLSERRLILRLTSSGRLADRTLEAFALASQGMSPSDLVRLVDGSLREALLGRESLEPVLARRLLRHGTESADRTALTAFAGLAVTEGGMSMRAVARLTGKSHPTVSRMVQKWQRDE